MTTKKEIQDKAIEEIKNNEIRLETLNKEHKKFEPEHNRLEEYNKKDEILIRKETDIINQKWKDNFESRDNWYHSVIPEKFNCIIKTIEDKELLLKALTEIANKNEESIKQTEEYKELEKEREKLVYPNFSKEHSELDREIERLVWEIEFNKRRISDMEDKGKLIKYSKHLKEREEIEKKERARETRLKEIRDILADKDMLTKLNVVDKLK